MTVPLATPPPVTPQLPPAGGLVTVALRPKMPGLLTRLVQDPALKLASCVLQTFTFWSPKIAIDTSQVLPLGALHVQVEQARVSVTSS